MDGGTIFHQKNADPPLHLLADTLLLTRYQYHWHVIRYLIAFGAAERDFSATMGTKMVNSTFQKIQKDKSRYLNERIA